MLDFELPYRDREAFDPSLSGHGTFKLIEGIDSCEATMRNGRGAGRIDEGHDDGAAASFAFGSEAGETGDSGNRRVVGKYNAVEPHESLPLLGTGGRCGGADLGPDW